MNLEESLKELIREVVREEIRAAIAEFQQQSQPNKVMRAKEQHDTEREKRERDRKTFPESFSG